MLLLVLSAEAVNNTDDQVRDQRFSKSSTEDCEHGPLALTVSFVVVVCFFGAEGASSSLQMQNVFCCLIYSRSLQSKLDVHTAHYRYRLDLLRLAGS